MREILAIHSAEGDYFYVGINDKGFYLRNEYTTIPNEFEKYSMRDIKKLFDGLCERIPECVAVDHVRADRHVNSFMYVVYDDGTEQLYMEQKGVGMNLCTFTHSTAEYNEFFNGRFWSYNPGTLNLKRLRQVCKSKKEDLDILFRAVCAMDEDDYIDLELEPRPDGGYNIVKSCYGVTDKEYITIMKDGRIDNTGQFTYTKLLKEQGVRIY